MTTISIQEQEFLKQQQLYKDYYGLTNSDIEHIVARLPNKVFYEYGYHKYFSQATDLTFDAWQDWAVWQYPIIDLVKFQKVILDNAEFLKDKTVVDFACHIGYHSLFCLHLGARHVTATNVRKHCLDIANDMIAAAGHGDKFTSVAADIHDYTKNTELCTGVDTVLLNGILYHVHDHLEILESITRPRPSCVIIETMLARRMTANNDIPFVEYLLEDAESDLHGFYNNNNKVLAGYPNEAYLNMIMGTLGYKNVRSETYSKLNDGTGLVCVYTLK